MDITTKIQALSDLELAVLLCFVADQHCCIIQADEEFLPPVARELELVSSTSVIIFVVAN
jgi:hypothetical protein